VKAEGKRNEGVGVGWRTQRRETYGRSTESWRPARTVYEVVRLQT
jgi:hypothetical protein